MTAITDKYGRTFRTLRVSLLQQCNMACVYCVSDEEKLVPGDGRSLEVGELLQLIRRLQGRLQLTDVRLTGGEPLLYPGLASLISGIRELGIRSVKLTTNGLLLGRQAVMLRQAGLEAVNVSLDAVDEEVFFRMTRRHGVRRVIDGIDAAIAAGLDVKVNAVIMRGVNDSEVLPLLEFAFLRGLRLRFLEVMAMGHLHDAVGHLHDAVGRLSDAAGRGGDVAGGLHDSAELSDDGGGPLNDAAGPLNDLAGRYLFSQEALLSVIGARHRLEPLAREASATARYWRTAEGHVFGIIANQSQPFCRDCDRLRLDSKGRIYGCLSSNEPIGLSMDEGEEEWSRKLASALLQKQALRFTGSELSMRRIGG